MIPSQPTASLTLLPIESSQRHHLVSNFMRAESDRHDARWTVEIPSARQSDSAFIQIVLAHMNEHGKAIIHLSNSTLFTRNEIREYLVRNNLLDAVISLPSGAIANMGSTSCLLVLDRTGHCQHQHGRHRHFLLTYLTISPKVSPPAMSMSSSTFGTTGTTATTHTQTPSPQH